MNLWFSAPHVIVPEARAGDSVEAPDPILLSVYAAYGRSTLIPPSDVRTPRALGTAELLAAGVVRAAAEDGGGPERVQVLLDCRSGAHVGGPAPSYVLAEESGLTHAIPIALGGQGGAEVATAFHCILSEPSLADTAVVSACQRVSWPDSRVQPDGTILADAAAAVAVGPTPESVNAAFRLIGVAVGVRRDKAVRDLTEQALRNSGRCVADLRWSIQARVGGEGLSMVGMREIRRTLWPDEDFGSPDLLLSLAATLKEDRPPKGLGVLVHCGWFDAVGVIVVEALT